MPTTAKKTIIEKYTDGAIISDKVKNYADEPYFVKKTSQARATLKRVGLPDQSKL
jgi:hypothetical protein